MNLKVIDKEFCIAKIKDTAEIDFSAEYVFTAKTDEEISIVCPIELIPPSTLAADPGWKAFRIEGTLDFSLIGILSKISSILAEANIGIFVISTYNTDYILTKRENFENALCVLRHKGYKIIT